MKIELSKSVDHERMKKLATKLYRVTKDSVQIVKTKDEAQNFGLKLSESKDQNGVIVISVKGSITLRPKKLKDWYSNGGTNVMVVGARSKCYIVLYY